VTNPIRVAIGLGNPGPRYERTRHNVGFRFVDRLARERGATFRAEPKLQSDTCEVVLDGLRLRLAKPQTFMNRSGRAVVAIVNFFKLLPEEILIVHDEIDLPVGAIRLKLGGGHGGHNGLRDIVQALGGSGFARLRIGVGHPGHKDEVIDYVLRAAPADETEAIEQCLVRGLEALPEIVRGEFPKAMSGLNRRRRRSSEPEGGAGEAADSLPRESSAGQ
jgi:PTH1 family peptidyl-tRNA hydrolase